MVNGSQGGTKAKRSESKTTDDILDQALNRDKKSRTSSDVSEQANKRTQDTKFAKIETNSFYKIIFSEGDPEAKKDEIAKVLSYDLESEKSDNKEKLAEFELFKEWLMDQRKDMAQEIINLTDTDAFSELKDVFDEMNQGLLDFENQMNPLTSILDAVYKLRMSSDGAMFDVFKEIQEDKEEEERIAALRIEQDSQLNALSNEVDQIQMSVARLEGQKSWFGLGGIKADALEQIKANQLELEKKNATIKNLTEEIKATTFNRKSDFEEFANEKTKLRELLDISSEEHKQRQQGLIDSANNFVTVADERTGNVLQHLEGINDQIERLGDSNSGLRSVYAIISEAVEDAEEVNKTTRDTLLGDSEDESNIAKMRRENNKMAVEDHITALTAAKVDTMGTFGDLTAESYRIKAMKDSNEGQVSKTRSLNSKGVSGVASRLSTVLQGVSMAALSESSEVAQMTLERMNTQTNIMAQQEALKNAMGINQENDALVKAIEELESYGKVARAATDISREGYQEMRENLESLEKTARDVGDAVKEAVAVGAEVMNEDSNEPASEAEQTTDSDNDSGNDGNPFNNLKV